MRLAVAKKGRPGALTVNKKCSKCAISRCWSCTLEHPQSGRRRYAMRPVATLAAQPSAVVNAGTSSPHKPQYTQYHTRRTQGERAPTNAPPAAAQAKTPQRDRVHHFGRR